MNTGETYEVKQSFTFITVWRSTRSEMSTSGL